MTRLKEDDIDTLVARIASYNKELQKQVGSTLAEIAKYSVGFKGKRNFKTAVIPVTTGLGIIKGFSETVCGILRYCGVDAFVTETTDVGGIQEAYRREADIVFLADDDVASAFTVKARHYSDNGEATGRSFAAALELGMKQDSDVLILGIGPVGQAAARYLKEKGKKVWIYDIDETKAAEYVQREGGMQQFDDISRMHEFSYIIDATTAADVISSSDVSAQTVIAAPGMPLGVEKEALNIATVIHNPLELGILAMYYDCARALDALDG